MTILIIGGSGFLGKRLAHALLKQGTLVINGQPPRQITRLVLFDRVKSDVLSEDPRLELVSGDICDTDLLKNLLKNNFDVIFHLAAIVSGDAERNFSKGMQVNLHASLQILEICRKQEKKSILIFASSCAVFGGEVTKTIIKDETATTPQSSYGTQKAIIELLINDYSRRAFIDGRILRLPTIMVRPGKANAANSSFASSIIREPLHGKKTFCPVSDNTKIWILSPRRVTENFIHAAGIESASLGHNRIITLPGLTTLVKEIKENLEALKGEHITSLIESRPDNNIQTMVDTWPTDFETRRANRLGFVRDISVEEIIQIFIDEEMT